MMNMQHQSMYPSYGMGYAAQRQIPFSNTLTAEEIKELRNKGSKFSLDIRPEEFKRSACVHRDQNNFWSAEEQHDGTSYCTICSRQFSLVNYSREEVDQAVQRVLDIIDTIKALYLNFPAETARQFFRFIPLLERVPELYSIALAEYNKFDNGAATSLNQPQWGFAAYNMLAQPTMAMGMPMSPAMPYNAQMMGQPMMMNPQMVNANMNQQAMYAQQQQAMMMNQQAMGGSPFVHGGPVGQTFIDNGQTQTVNAGVQQPAAQTTKSWNT